jgi:hypothetical protein
MQLRKINFSYSTLSISDYVPIVQVAVWSGITLENKKQTVDGITKVFADIGI